VLTEIRSESLKGRDSLRDLGVDGMIILKLDLKVIGCEGVDSFELG
jgi:hypothetical protein